MKTAILALLGVVAGYWLAMRRVKRQRADEDRRLIFMRRHNGVMTKRWIEYRGD